ncbi:DUF4280 domain-containing protein [Bordetella genomosp. 11]|uniref:DUF4280 domain-containing protein n=1 Tax=Bordetella genomosp. 11 TaxID=1416808 RepID=A0A261UL17_9BORD|nr:DUF4280 domain-containing protein [Bordetella genomosp. 11]OZI62227.1 hypothetical protein CAL28_23760 [Bordetella genomosp. 11]
MALPVVLGAELMCTFGTAPSTLIVAPESRVLVEGRPAANIEDNKPIVNIVPFTLCTSVANPAVESATAAAMGVLTPMPCIPIVEAPWMPGAPTVLVGGLPALDNNSRCMCQWAGVISIVLPGPVRTLVP